MIELMLLLGLGTIGYLLSRDNTLQRQENFVPYSPRPMEQHTEPIVHSQSPMGHNNEVPFFGARVTQSMYSGATDHVLDNHTGSGKEYFQKREVKSFFDAKPGTGNAFGNANESDFMQSRMVSGQNMKNVFPIEQVQVGPGADDGYTNIPKGGFQQDQLRNYALPKTTDEMRVATKPKLSYEPPVIPGQSVVTAAGVQADVRKNKPDRFGILGMDRVNTAVGAQTAPKIYAEQPMKTQARETTEREHFGTLGGAISVLAPYVRAFTEPYQEFMKLTTEGRPGPGGPNGSGFSIGADSYSAQSNRNEEAITESMRFNVGVLRTTAHAEHAGSYRFTQPLKEDAHVERNSPEILKSFNQNPYSQSLQSF